LVTSLWVFWFFSPPVSSSHRSLSHKFVAESKVASIYTRSSFVSSNLLHAGVLASYAASQPSLLARHRRWSHRGSIRHLLLSTSASVLAGSPTKLRDGVKLVRRMLSKVFRRKMR
ncbi:hypothetical protein GW17_00046137, partial [Ensete ventricosum]